MSLLLELIRQLLEYLGVPTEQFVPIWERFTRRHSFVRAIANRLPLVLFEGIDIQSIRVFERKNYGWTRSVVRIIGTLLPLEECRRPHFQKVLETGVLESKQYEAVKRPDIPSLADTSCLLNNNVMTYTRFRHDLPSGTCKVEPLSGLPNTDSAFLTMMSGNRVSENSLLPANDNAIQKIAALEDELMQLRAQIAAIVAMQESKVVQSFTESMCSFGSPNNALPPPSLASTPISAHFPQCTTPVAAPPPPPPPPPPPAPPPLPSNKLNSAKSAIDLIKERRASQKCRPMEKDVSEKSSVDKLPSMMDVLKGMNSIKLRAVERSPGGTPLTQKDKKRRSLNDPTDPAAIIAHALKQKFAHRHNDDSMDKENRSYEDSPFSSPEAPMFGRHLLKPIGKRTQREMIRKQVHV